MNTAQWIIMITVIPAAYLVIGAALWDMHIRDAYFQNKEINKDALKAAFASTLLFWPPVVLYYLFLFIGWLFKQIISVFIGLGFWYRYFFKYKSKSEKSLKHDNPYR